MANFDGLIRQALARYDDTDPAVRQAVYQSSRNALARMVASGQAQSPDVINRRRDALEQSIRSVEESYLANKSGPKTPPPPATAESGRGEDELPSRDDHLDEPVIFDDEFESDVDDLQGVSAGDNPYPLYRRSPKRRRRAVGIGVVLVVLALAAWLAYVFLTSLAGDTPRLSGNGEQSSGDSAQAPGETPGEPQYIVLLSPADSSALQTEGRGRAEIVSLPNAQVIRLASTRQNGARDNPADPMRIEVKPGVVEQIAGRKVTVEIQAKSGSAGPATFAVGCEFGGQDICGRKRFRVGLQPEDIVFTIDVDPGIVSSQPSFFTLSTDISSSAAQTGEGEVVDVFHARIRLPGS